MSRTCGSISTIVPIINTDASYLKGVTISAAAPSNSQVLTYNSGALQWEAQTTVISSITRTSGAKEFWIDITSGNDSNNGETSGTPVQTWPVLMVKMQAFSYDIGIINLVAGQSITNEFSVDGGRIWIMNSKATTRSWDFTPVGGLYEKIVVKGGSTVNLTTTPNSTANYYPFISTINPSARYNYTDVSAVTGSDIAGIYIPSLDTYQTTNGATSTSAALFTAQRAPGSVLQHYIYGIDTTATSISPSVTTAIVSSIPVYFERIKFNGSSQAILFIGPNFTFRGSYVHMSGFNNLSDNVMIIGSNVVSATANSTFSGVFTECIFPGTCTLEQGCSIRSYNTIFNTLTTAQSSPSDNGIQLSTWDCEVNTLSNFRNGLLELHHMGINTAVINSSTGTLTDSTVRGQFTIDLSSNISLVGGNIILNSGTILVDRGSKLTLLTTASVQDSAGAVAIPIIHINNNSHMYCNGTLSLTSSRTVNRFLIERKSILHVNNNITINGTFNPQILVNYGSQICSRGTISGPAGIGGIIVRLRNASWIFAQNVNNTTSFSTTDIQCGTSGATSFGTNVVYTTAASDELCMTEGLF